MAILVTGGAGFIGSHFIKYMLDRYNYSIINLDKLTYAGNLDNVRDVEDHPRYSFVKGDICDGKLLENIFSARPIQGVIHFAAESHVDRSIEDGAIFLRTNVLGTQALLDAAKKHWWKHPRDESSKGYWEGVRFLQISTDEVYGALGPEGRFTEGSPLCPNSPYSASKAGADMMVRAYHQTYGFPALITRCSNNYGPYQHGEKLIPLMIHRALQDQPLPIYGDGRQIRDWLYVEDQCRAIDLVFHKGRIGEVYNIGGNNEWENIQVVKTILRYLGKDEGLIRHVEDRLGHDRRYAIDSSKITRELGWVPRVDFKEGLVKTVDWYLGQHKK